MKEALEIPTQDWNLFNEPHKKGREGGGCEWRTRDRQTDRHSANTRKRQTDRHSAYLQAASFFGSLPILYSHHDFPSNISPGFYGAFMFSFLCFPSVHFMCVVIDLGSESLAHLSQISKLPSSCSVANRAEHHSQMPQMRSASSLGSLTVCALCDLSSYLGKALKCRVEAGVTTATLIFLLLLLNFQAPICHWNVGYFSVHCPQCLQKQTLPHATAYLASFSKSVPEKLEVMTFLYIVSP